MIDISTGRESSNGTISEVKLRLLDEEDAGLVGFASCVLHGEYFLNNIAIRRSRGGSLFLVYPAMESRNRARYHHWNPITRHAAAELEQAILRPVREMGA